MWKTFEVELQFTTNFASSTPKNPEDIKAMLEARSPNTPPAGAIPLEQLAEKVGEEVEASEEVERGFATFKRDDEGLYYEARCVRGHIKDCANQLQGLLGIKALKAKVANKVYVEPQKIRLNIDVPDGNETRIIHAMTNRGPRSSFKFIDYVTDARLKFSLRVLDDGVIDKGILEAIFEYGGTHGIGQERSQDWGKYNLVKLQEIGLTSGVIEPVPPPLLPLPPRVVGLAQTVRENFGDGISALKAAAEDVLEWGELKPRIGMDWTEAERWDGME